MKNNILNKKHKGVVAFEYTLLMPLVYLILLFIISFYGMVVSYIFYNNMANLMAQELNMRQHGYQQCLDNYNSFNKTIKTGSISQGINNKGKSYIVYNDARNKNIPVTINNGIGNNYLQAATYFAINKYNNTNGFLLAFSEVNSISVSTYKIYGNNRYVGLIGPDQNQFWGDNMSNTIIQVDINFKSLLLNFLINNIVAHGYAIIS